MRLRRLYIILFAGLFFGQFLPNKAHAQELDYKAYTLYIYNFIKYMEWPEEQLKQDFVIGVFGESPIISELEELASIRQAKDRKMVIKKITSLDQISFCHILFIPNNKSSLIRLISEKTKDMPVLIVSERDGLTKKGAGISFLMLEDETLKFEVNKTAIENRKLKISNILVKLGFVVG